jgi:hypothetical protein
MVSLACYLARVHPQDLSIFGMMILIDTPSAGGLLTKFKPSLIESSPHGIPSLGVQSLVTRFKCDASFIPLKASILLKGFDQDFVTGYRNIVKSLSRIIQIATGGIQFAHVAGDWHQPPPTASRIRGSFKVPSNAP